MNRVDQNINKDMINNCDLIDVESVDYSDDQTWLYTLPEDSGQRVDIVEYILSCDWPINKDDEYLKSEKELHTVLDTILKNEVAIPDRHKFDSRTYVKPKKRMQRPSIQSIMEVTSNPPSLSPHPSMNTSTNKYLTYNKYNNPLGPISPMLRLKTFNVDTNSDNSHTVKEFAMKRRSYASDEDPQLEGIASDGSERLDQVSFKSINIDLSQPAHNVYNMFNKGLMNMMQDSGSMNMEESGESLMRVSPPSLVSSMVMESSGNFNAESMDSRRSISQRDSGLPTSGRDSLDPMLTSMTLSILDEKDMSTSFLSQTTYPDNDNLMDSLPPSLVSSVNSSYIVSNTSKPRGDMDTNIFSSATFTHLEQSEKLLSARPRCQLYNSFTKRDSIVKNSESYTKSREEACQIDTVKVLNENCNTVSPQTIKSYTKPKANGEMSETITLHYSNNKFKRDNDAEKENLNATFKCDDAFYNEMDSQKTEALHSLTMDKQELNEIIQARQKLSLARKALPSEPDKPVPNPDLSPIKTIQLPNQTIITVPRQSMENASELLSRRRAMGTYDKQEEHTRDTPKRNATFKKLSPKASAMDSTVVYVKPEENIIDINSATMSLIDSAERTLAQEDWNLQERAMVGSNESTGTDTGTFSSSSPPESVPEHTVEPRTQVASTPLMAFKKGKNELLDLHSTISPIYDMVEEKSYTITKASSSDMEKTYDMNTTVINSATMIKKTSAKRDILAMRPSPEKKPGILRSPTRRISPTDTGSYTAMAPPTVVPRKTSLPTSKLRQYSSHKELNRIPGNPPPACARVLPGRPMVRRSVYASNPALSPTAPQPHTAHGPYTTHGLYAPHGPPATGQPARRDSNALYRPQEIKKQERPTLTNPPPLVRQGTETLRRERPQSQLVAPKDTKPPLPTPNPTRPTTNQLYRYVQLRSCGVPVSRNHYASPPTTRPYSIVESNQLRVSRPTSVPLQKPLPVVCPSEARPATVERVSALPRPSRLPAPRRALRPPSVYSVAPPGDVEHH